MMKPAHPGSGVLVRYLAGAICLTVGVTLLLFSDFDAVDLAMGIGLALASIGLCLIVFTFAAGVRRRRTTGG